MIKMKTNVTPGETPEKITVSMIDQDLKDGISKPEMATKYGIKPWEVDEIFKHPFLKGRRPSRKKSLSFSFVDDITDDILHPEDAEVVTITSEDGDPVVVNNPNQVTLEDAIIEATESVETVKDQMLQTQEAINEILSPTELKSTKEFVEDLVEMNNTEKEAITNEFEIPNDNDVKTVIDSLVEEIEIEEKDDNTFEL